MKRGTAWLVFGALVAAVVLWWIRAPKSTPNEKAEKSAASVSAGAPAPQSASAPAISQAEVARQGSPLAAELNAADTPPERDVAILSELMSQYLTALQRRAGPPIGDDADLVRALTGRNPLKLTVIPASHPAISPEGRLLDRWSTPYHVHAKSARSFEFRSAGPDKRLFTADDFVSP